jgi:hypothetical protein
VTIRTFGDHDAATIQQLENCVAAEDGASGVLCADGHLGYSTASDSRSTPRWPLMRPR